MHEALGLVAVCFVLALLLYLFIALVGTSVVEEYCFYNEIELDEFALYRLDMIMFGVGFAVSAMFFVILFFVLFGERLAYIRKITAGVDALRQGSYGEQVELFGNNELTELAQTVNYLSQSEQEIKEKERRLREEKEELIRTLSHDIRTPLTSVMAYTELLAAKEAPTEQELSDYLLLVGKKTAQIKQLTDILLDGGRREPEEFEDARLLFTQLADEFASELEDGFDVRTDTSSLPAFFGRFDVRELHRIFDNLISNVKKYADPARQVCLEISLKEGGAVICQRNGTKKEDGPTEGHRLGLYSIRRIAQNHGGSARVSCEGGIFEITVTLSDIG